MISIIIPVLNEEKGVKVIVDHLNQCNGIKDQEILFVDGGSSDSTMQILKKEGEKVIQCPQRGRAKQMNFGVSKANGDVYFFLHSDSKPPIDFIDRINSEIENGYSAGCFRLSFDSKHPVLNFYSWFTKFDIDYFRFGDQGLFITAELFNNVNGYDEHHLVMEDQHMVRQVKRLSGFKIIHADIVTSARKYHKNGVVRLQFIFMVIVFLYYAGVSQERLVEYYKSKLR